MDEPGPDRAQRTIRDPLVGSVLDRRYRIDGRLAAGGFGAIYRATDAANGQSVALKVLHAALTTDPDVVARFRREAAALASLRDPHTVKAYAIGETRDGTLYIVMELLHGESLAERFRRLGPLPWRRVVATRVRCAARSPKHTRSESSTATSSRPTSTSRMSAATQIS
jgi:serine/threonine-protein kinase